MGNSAFPIFSDKPKSASACSTGGANVFDSGESHALHAGSDFAGNVALVTLGCAKNLVDSEVMLGVLKSRGFRSVSDPSDADLIVVNTCAFLRSAVEEGIDTILDLAQFKTTGRCRKLIVAGCMVERYRKDLQESLPEVDRFLSTDELLSVADESGSSVEALDGARRPYFLYDESMPRVVSTSGASAYVKIAEGCDRPCAFCIIPKIRGEFRSRPIESVLSEVRHLIQGGVREINLVAQDLTSYGVDFDTGGKRLGKPKLLDLLENISALSTGLREGSEKFWLRLLYAYPIGVNEELIEHILASPVICNYLDLPLQHISGPVLKRMNRPLGERGTRGLIERIHSFAPELSIRTTFVVGFPGETEDDIRSLEEFVRSGFFRHVGVFPYSQEAEAKSYTFEDQIPEELKLERVERVMAIQKEIVGRRNQDFVGRSIEVLVEGGHEESELLISARAEWQAPEIDGRILINDVTEDLRDENGEVDQNKLAGRFARAVVTEVADYDLIARLEQF